jgi:hypothetical protein
MKIYIYLFFLFFLITCKNNSNKNLNIDKFYTEKGDWDAGRIPLIKPYEAIIANKDMGWGMNLDGKDGDTGFFNIKRVNVVNDIVLVYSINSIFHGNYVKQSWHIIIPKKHIEKGFESYQQYLDYLKKIGIETEPRLHDIDSVADYFENHDTINWNANY